RCAARPELAAGIGLCAAAGGSRATACGLPARIRHAAGRAARSLAGLGGDGGAVLGVPGGRGRGTRGGRIGPAALSSTVTATGAGRRAHRPLHWPDTAPTTARCRQPPA